MAERVYIGLGSNLDDPLAQVTKAVTELAAIANTKVVAVSPWYQSTPIGPEQPDFINGVAALETELSPIAMLDALQAIEQDHQRVRDIHWGPRTLDLDLLLFGDACIDSPLLTLPHPHIAARDFVLVPLLQIAPDACDPISAVPYAHHLKQLRAAELPAVAELTLPMTQHHARAH